MTWLERLGRVIRAQINTFVDEVEDPEKILEQAVLKMEQELIAMRRALAEAIATYKSAERHIASHQLKAQQWYERAQLALDKGSEDLAKDALVKRQSYQLNAQALQTQLEQQSEIIDRLKTEFQTLERKYIEAKTKKSLYVARLRSALASQKLEEIVGTVNTNNSLSVFEQIEAKILELEAQSELIRGNQKDPLEQKFAALESNTEVDLELANLKAKRLRGS